MSQNVTLSATDWQDIAKIKGYLLQHKNQTEIAELIGKRRETINRKIARWMVTSDFDEWANTLWLEQYGELSVDDKKEAFRQLTKLICAKQTRRMEVKEEISERLEVVHLNVTENEDNILNKAATILNKRLSSKDKPNKIH